MKLKMVVVLAAIGFGLSGTALAANYSDLAAQGFRWIDANGPYACPSQDDLRRITRNHTDAIELQMVDDLKAYYIIPGTVVHVVQEDRAAGMSQVQIGGITRDLWTYTKYLSKRPVEDPYGVIETPETSGLIPTATTGMIQLPEESGATPAPSVSAAPSVSPTPHARHGRKSTLKTKE